jgi:hypothetical protein
MVFWDISVNTLIKLLLETVQYVCKANPAPALSKDPTQWLNGAHLAADK